jgi:hypothetical protein
METLWRYDWVLVALAVYLALAFGLLGFGKLILYVLGRSEKEK